MLLIMSVSLIVTEPDAEFQNPAPCELAALISLSAICRLVALLSLVEAILENPEVILRKQLDKLKGEEVARMKEAGIDYEERMEKLEAMEHPKPERDFIYTTFNQFAKEHPWVGDDNTSSACTISAACFCSRRYFSSSSPTSLSTTLAGRE